MDRIDNDELYEDDEYAEEETSKHTDRRTHSKKGGSIIKFAGAAILSATILAGAGIALQEATIDHTKQVCILSEVFGMSHQASALAKEGYVSLYPVDTISIMADAHVMPDGSTVYTAPEGYTLIGAEASKQIENKDTIIVKKQQGNELVYVNTLHR